MVTYTQKGEGRTHKTTPTRSTENLDELVKIYIVYTEDHKDSKHLRSEPMQWKCVKNENKTWMGT